MPSNSSPAQSMVHLVALAQFVQSHILGIVLAIIVSYAIGFAWHGPIFGKQWMKYNNMTPPKKGEMKFSMMMPGLLANLVATFVQAAVIGRSFELLFLPSAVHAIIIATIFWLPFTGLVMLNNYMWLGKPLGHYVLDAAYTLVSIWAVALVMYATL